ncbi:MAG: mitochondrial ribosomal small subunit component [Vezdaea aestivalis]|nr:MAG: mitochondrial ribosomal small subunit component [Vezdaea aestivalis]
MGPLNLRALRVKRNATDLLETGRVKHIPAWFNALSLVAPPEPLIRTQPIRHANRKLRQKGTGPRALYRPQRITYKEDAIRQEFFQRHPWELARPRIVLERDGKDVERTDWAHLKQEQRQLDGESVVQHQLWLEDNVQGISRDEAYDTARRRFYALRLQEDVERRISLEEASYTGAHFGPSAIEIGHQLEQKAFEAAKVWAAEVARRHNVQKQAAYTSSKDDVVEDEEEEEDELGADISPEDSSRKPTPA